MWRNIRVASWEDFHAVAAMRKLVLHKLIKLRYFTETEHASAWHLYILHKLDNVILYSLTKNQFFKVPHAEQKCWGTTVYSQWHDTTVPIIFVLKWIGNILIHGPQSQKGPIWMGYFFPNNIQANLLNTKWKCYSLCNKDPYYYMTYGTHIWNFPFYKSYSATKLATTFPWLYLVSPLILSALKNNFLTCFFFFFSETEQAEKQICKCIVTSNKLYVLEGFEPQNC